MGTALHPSNLQPRRYNIGKTAIQLYGLLCQCIYRQTVVHSSVYPIVIFELISHLVVVENQSLSIVHLITAMAMIRKRIHNNMRPTSSFWSLSEYHRSARQYTCYRNCAQSYMWRPLIDVTFKRAVVNLHDAMYCLLNRDHLQSVGLLAS